MGRVRSATLVETIIAAVVVLALFVIVSVVVMNINNSTVSFSRIKAQQLINVYAGKAGKESRFIDVSAQEGNLRIEQHVLELINSRAARLSFIVFDKTGKILEQQERILLIE